MDEGLRDGIGLGARYLIEHALLKQGITVDKRTLAAIHSDFVEHYRANICLGTRLFIGTERLLARFSNAGWSFAICTNKPVELSRLLLRNLGVADSFIAICGGDSFVHRKPDPGHLLETISAAAGKRERTIMVGDSQTDLDTARGADVPFVGVSFGYTPIAMTELRPDLMIDSFDELTPRRASALLEQDRSGRRVTPASATTA
jgi:phosphoglycolate phosphatase